MNKLNSVGVHPVHNNEQIHLLISETKIEVGKKVVRFTVRSEQIKLISFLVCYMQSDSSFCVC